MLPYINELSQEEQEKLQEMIRRLFRQTFLLERKYDKKAGRMVADKDFYFADRHMDFLKDYFAAAGICLEQNTELGTIYLTGETTMGERIPKLATIYLLLLKLIYDEQMASASTSSYVVTTRAQVQEKMDSFKLLSRQPPAAEVRSAIRILKKYQMIDFIDSGEELEPDARFLIYPTINMLLMGEEIQRVAKAYANEEGEDDDSTI